MKFRYKFQDYNSDEITQIITSQDEYFNTRLTFIADKASIVLNQSDGEKLCDALRNDPDWVEISNGLINLKNISKVNYDPDELKYPYFLSFANNMDEVSITETDARIIQNKLMDNSFTR